MIADQKAPNGWKEAGKLACCCQPTIGHWSSSRTDFSSHTHTQRTAHIDSQTDWGKGISARNLSTLISELNLCNKTASSTAIFAVRVPMPMPGRIWLHLAVPSTSLDQPERRTALALWQSSHERLQFLIELSVRCWGAVAAVGEGGEGVYPCPYPKTFPGRGWGWRLVYGLCAAVFGLLKWLQYLRSAFQP